MIPEKIEALKICLEFMPGNASVEQVLTEAEKVYRWLADLTPAPQSSLPAQLPLRLQSAQPKSAHSNLVAAWQGEERHSQCLPARPLGRYP